MKRERLIDEAAAWFARLDDPAATAADREAFDAWLLSSPAHIEAHLAVSRTWGDLGLALDDAPDVEALVRAARAELEPANVAPLPAVACAPEQTRPAGGRRWYAAAAGLALTVGMAVYWMSRDEAVLRTQIGEQRSVTLPDGSVVHLNTASEVRIALDERLRRIELSGGEARFTVARDAQRPFLVVTPQATVRVLGTTFNVQATAGQTAVTVIEGRVAVGGADVRAGAGASVVELGAGELAAVTDRGEILPDTGPSVEQALAWTQRQLVFRDEPLAEVVAEFNRYRPQAIRIDDARLAAMKINGVFDAGDAASLIEYLQRYRGVRVEPLPGGGQRIASDP